MRCKFGYYSILSPDMIYTGIVENQTFPKDIKLEGRHELENSNDNVDAIFISKCNIVKIPQSLSLIFPNLSILVISDSDLNELNRADLLEYQNLKQFHFINNPLTFLPGDLFRDFKELEVISFSNNMLHFIEPNILDGLDKLKCVKFEEEVNYDLCYSTIQGSRCNTTLDGMKKVLYETFIYELRRANDELAQTNAQLIQENKKIINESNKWKLESMKLSSEIGVLKAEQINVTSVLTADFHVDKEKSIDLKIIVDGHEFSAHKFVLATRSPILAQMIQERPDAESLNLDDISVGIFDQILKYIYTNKFPRDIDFLNLFAAAGRLQIKELIDYAALKVIKFVYSTNALEVFELSCKYGHDELKKKAYAEIKKKYPSINFRDEWLIQSDKLTKIIEGFKKQEEEMKKFECEFEEMAEER